jgi:hypothetical protein
MTVLEIARIFATSLDADQVEPLSEILHPECRYQSPKGELIGFKAIAASYQTASEGARATLEKLEFRSEVEELDSSHVRVKFFDIITHQGQQHTYCCHQLLTIENGQITEIIHQEIPGEREAVDAFLGGC